MTAATGRTLYLTIVCVAVLWVGYLARAVVTPLLIALTLAYMLDPVVRVLERRGLSRAAASGTVVVVALAALAGLATVAVTQLANEASDLYADVVGEDSEPLENRSKLESRVTPADAGSETAAQRRARILQTTWPAGNGERIAYFDENDDRVYQPGHAALAIAKVKAAIRGTAFEAPLKRGIEGAASFGPKLAESASSFLTTLLKGGEAMFAGVLVVILFPIYLYYSLVSLSRVYEVTVRHLPETQRPRIVEILRKIHVTMSAFFRGRLITLIVKGVLLLGLFVAFGVPFSYVCAGFAALASLVPVVGGVAAAIPPLALALPSSTGTEMLGLLAGIVVIEILEGYVLIPALVGKSVGLHPLTVLVCTLVAGDLLGFFGMIVAVPLTAVLKILAAEYVLPEVRRRAGLEPAPAAAAAPAPPETPPSPPPAAGGPPA